MKYVLTLVSLFFLAVAAQASTPRGRPDFRLRVEEADRTASSATIVADGSKEARAKLASQNDLFAFLSTLKPGQELRWEIGCDTTGFVERDAAGFKKRKDGLPDFYLPLGKERVPLTAIEQFCEDRGAKFTFGFGF